LVPLPDVILDALEALCPREDRDVSARVLPGWSDDGLRNAMGRACRFAAIPAYSPNDLQHRYISRPILARVPLALVHQVVGHSRARVTLDVYSHVILGEPAAELDALRRLVIGLFDGEERAPRGHTAGLQESENPVRAGLSHAMEDTGIEPVTSTLPA
jgi:integrase